MTHWARGPGKPSRWSWGSKVELIWRAGWARRSALTNVGKAAWPVSNKAKPRKVGASIDLGCDKDLSQALPNHDGMPTSNSPSVSASAASGEAAEIGPKAQRSIASRAALATARTCSSVSFVAFFSAGIADRALGPIALSA